jgi:hypothetical protein
MKNFHGGRRDGAGRKSTGRTERKTYFLSPEIVKILSKFSNPSIMLEHAVRTCLTNAHKFYGESVDGLSLGQIHVQKIVSTRMPEYEKISSKLESEGWDSVREDFRAFWESFQSDLFANYFVHTDFITAQPLDESKISHHYLDWLYQTAKQTGKLKELKSQSLTVRLDRYFHEDESDWPSEISPYDLAFLGGLQYTEVYHHLFSLAKKGNVARSSRGWEVYYYKQDGIIQASGYGSSQLLAHILLGNPTINPNSIILVDREPDPELNKALIGWDCFFEECSSLTRAEHKINRKFHLDYQKPYEEQGELAKTIWDYLERKEEKELKENLKQALMQPFLYWETGSTNQELFSIYDLSSLIKELQKLMNRPFLDIRNPIVLEIKNAWGFSEKTSTPLEDWFYNLPRTS